MRMSSNSRMLPRRIFPSLAVEVAAVRVRRRRAADPQLRDAEREAVAADDEARDGARAGGGRIVDVVPDARVVRLDDPAHVELREEDARAVDAHELLARGPAGSYLIWMPSRGDRDDVRDDDLEARDAEAELAGHVDPDVAAQEAEGVDGEVERAEDPDEVDGDAALRVAWSRVPLPSAERRAVEADRDRQHDHAVLEADVGEADRRPLQAQRPEGDGDDARRRARRRGAERERLRQAGAVPVHGAAERIDVARRLLVQNEFVSNAIVTAPAWKSSIALLGFLSFRK